MTMAGNGCDAELRLWVGSYSSSTESNTTRPIRVEGGCNQQHQQITVLYNGQICAGVVTEIQARAIISMAKREKDGTKESSPLQTPPPSPSVGPQLDTPGLSMKRSLQRFLQQRKSRIDNVAPYHQVTKCKQSAIASLLSL